jgi:uncharacterized protein YjiS (DUF1127 family)
MLQEIPMLSNISRSSNTRPDDPHNAVAGPDAPIDHDAPIDNVDGVFAAKRKLALVPRPDLGAREIHAIGRDSTNEANNPPLPFWSVVFTNLMEGLVLYGASVHPNAFPIELFRTGDNVSQPDEIFRPRGLHTVVASSANAGESAALAPHREQPSGNTAVASVESGFFESEGVKPAGGVRRSARRFWNLIAGVRAHWRREREIKKAVYALAEFDDRTLRDMGIPDRSQIERTVRQGRDR